MYQCSKCGSSDLCVEATSCISAYIDASGDIIDEKGGDTEWQEDSPMRCCACQHSATSKDFWKKDEDETWTVAVSKRDTGMDTLWRSSFGRFCISDGTHPTQLEDSIEHYIVDIKELRQPIAMGSGKRLGGFPYLICLSNEQTFKSHRVMEAYLLQEGIITNPITYKLA